MSAEQLAPLLTPGSLPSDDSNLVDESFILPILTALDGVPEVRYVLAAHLPSFILPTNMILPSILCLLVDCLFACLLPGVIFSVCFHVLLCVCLFCVCVRACVFCVVSKVFPRKFLPH